MDVRQARWSEQPDYVLNMLRIYLRMNEATDPMRLQARRLEERQVLWTAARKRLRTPWKRWFFDFVLRMSRRGLVQRENIKNEGVHLVAVIRRTALEAGRRLTARGILREPEEVFLVSVEELEMILLGRSPTDLRGAIESRQADFMRHQELSPPPVVVGDYTPELGAAQERLPDCRVLRGLPVSPGVVCGRAQIVLHANSSEQVQPGEILIAPYTDPGWTPYFLSAAALVVDVGGQLSHGSVVAREYGLPAVVNVGPATRLIRPGQVVRVDGNRGTVTVFEPEVGEQAHPSGHDQNVAE